MNDPRTAPRTWIRGATIVTSDGEIGTGDLVLADGRIEGAEPRGPVDHEVDATGLVATAAFIDPHVHLREPGFEVKEDLVSGLAAAAAGGYGTVVSMANTDPVVDEPGLVRSLIEKAERLGGTRLRPAAALSMGLRGERLTDAAALAEAGAVMLTDDGIPVVDGELMRRACEWARDLDLVVQTHSEDPTLRGDGVMNEGAVSERLGLPGNPRAAEAAMTYRDAEIARLTGARVHIAHVSCRAALDVVAFFKEKGVSVTCEVTPHHLTLTDEALASFDPVFKVAPPLRTADDVQALRDGIRSGLVDCLGTDHAPHTREEKQRDLLSAPFGIAHIEVAFPVLYEALVLGGVVALPELLRLLQDGPADVMGWPAPSLAEGAPADVVLLDLDTARTVDPGRFLSKAKFGPWDGQTLRGWPMRTWVAGREVFRRDDAR
ncbi:MAG: dihydroorotase [Trueperaceae bacterium]|nr:dihydroorotase [Trueperaceae bacterium]